MTYPSQASEAILVTNKLTASSNQTPVDVIVGVGRGGNLGCLCHVVTIVHQIILNIKKRHFMKKESNKRYDQRA